MQQWSQFLKPLIILKSPAQYIARRLMNQLSYLQKLMRPDSFFE